MHSLWREIKAESHFCQSLLIFLKEPDWIKFYLALLLSRTLTLIKCCTAANDYCSIQKEFY